MFVLFNCETLCKGINEHPPKKKQKTKLSTSDLNTESIQEIYVQFNSIHEAGYCFGSNKESTKINVVGVFG